MMAQRIIPERRESREFSGIGKKESKIMSYSIRLGKDITRDR
jgi:hypothetical protein